MSIASQCWLAQPTRTTYAKYQAEYSTENINRKPSVVSLFSRIDEMDNICWCLAKVPEAIVDLSGVKPRGEDFKGQVRDAMALKLGGRGPSGEKTENVDDLIMSRNEEEISLDSTMNDEPLDIVIGGIRSLIAMNDQLLLQCEKYRWESEGGFTYQRIEINSVKVESAMESEAISRIMVKTVPRRRTKDFGLPSDIPAALTDIIVYKPGRAGLPDYAKFMERALLLNNTVLKPFLHIFTIHLEGIAAFFKEVLAWTAEPDADRAFLEKTFDLDFDLCLPSVEKVRKEPEDDATQATADSEDVLGHVHSEVRRTVVDEEILLREYRSEGSYTLSFSIEQGQTEKLVKFIGYLEN